MQQAQLGIVLLPWLHGLRQHPHTETKKEAANGNRYGRQYRTNVSPAVSLSKKKGAAIGRVAAYRSLEKLGQLYNHLPAAMTREGLQ
jgi:hypothetical protein